VRQVASVVVMAVILAAPTEVSAQGGPGFFFKRPVVSLGIRVGYSAPRTGGDLFAFTLDEFIPSGADTLSSLKFGSPYVGGELAIHPWERWDVAVGFGWTRSRSMSEYRRWVDPGADPADPADDLPIEQETTFQVVTGTLGAKYYLQERGRRVGSLAWVPQKLTPFVGAGIGVASYEFVQAGDFIDTNTFEVLGDYLKSSGEGFLAYASAGADLVLWRNAIVTAEARYSLSNAGVDGEYVGFGDVDLAGLQLMVGMGFQF